MSFGGEKAQRFAIPEIRLLELPVVLCTKPFLFSEQEKERSYLHGIYILLEIQKEINTFFFWLVVSAMMKAKAWG
jgi:hypothetical protein